MYPNATLVKKTGVLMGVVAGLGVAIALVLWAGGGRGPGLVAWNLPLLALAVFQWLRGAQFESLRAEGRPGVATATAYPGFGELAVRVVPDDGTRPFEAVITGGRANRPALGSTHRAFFRQAGPRAISVVLGEQITMAASALPSRGPQQFNAVTVTERS